MNRPSLKARLRYAFDNYMARGTGALIIGLFAISVVVVVAIALVVESPVGSTTRRPGSRLPSGALAGRLMRTSTPAPIGSDTGTVGLRLRHALRHGRRHHHRSHPDRRHQQRASTKLDDLRKGHSQVIEHDHIVILGWSPQVFPIISELLRPTPAARSADRRAGRQGQDRDGGRDPLIESPTPSDPHRLSERDPIDVDVIDICSPQTARSIIVLSPRPG